MVSRTLFDAFLAAGGAVQVWRVSCAKARGAAARYRYYGAVPYLVRRGRGRGNAVVAVPQRAARSDRRSVRLAERDAESYADARGTLAAGLYASRETLERVACVALSCAYRDAIAAFVAYEKALDRLDMPA